MCEYCSNIIRRLVCALGVVSIFLYAKVSFLQELTITTLPFDIFAVELPANVETNGAITIDHSGSGRISFISNSKNLTITLASPDGSEYVSESGVNGNVNSYIFPTRSDEVSGISYIFEISDILEGEWSYRITDSDVVQEDSLLFIQVPVGREINAAILGGGDSYEIGALVTLSTMVINNGQLHPEYTVAGEIRNVQNNGIWEPLTFIDDGNEADAERDDGIKTTLYEPLNLGTYFVRAKIVGTKTNGSEFERHVYAEFDIVGPNGEFPRDSDNDGILDENDAFPNDQSESHDFDSDGIGDNSDTDDDNDGIDDENDVFPLNGEEHIDSDNDGIGDNADKDDDNDGFTDIFESDCGTDSNDVNSVPSYVNGELDCIVVANVNVDNDGNITIVLSGDDLNFSLAIGLILPRHLSIM